MKLSFCARGDHLVTLPGSPRMVGQVQARVGRTFVAATAGNAGGHPANKEPFTCDSESETGQRLTKLCRRDLSLFAFDRETAGHCQVEFVEIEYSDADKAWVPKKKAEKASKTAAVSAAGAQ